MLKLHVIFFVFLPETNKNEVYHLYVIFFVFLPETNKNAVYVKCETWLCPCFQVSENVPSLCQFAPQLCEFANLANFIFGRERPHKLYYKMLITNYHIMINCIALKSVYEVLSYYHNSEMQTCISKFWLESLLLQYKIIDHINSSPSQQYLIYIGAFYKTTELAGPTHIRPL